MIIYGSILYTELSNCSMYTLCNALEREEGKADQKKWEIQAWEWVGPIGWKTGTGQLVYDYFKTKRKVQVAQMNIRVLDFENGGTGRKIFHVISHFATSLHWATPPLRLRVMRVRFWEMEGGWTFSDRARRMVLMRIEWRKVLHTLRQWDSENGRFRSSLSLRS